MNDRGRVILMPGRDSLVTRETLTNETKSKTTRSETRLAPESETLERKGLANRRRGLLWLYGKSSR